VSSNIRIDPRGFQESTTRELDEVQNRVRNLIGIAHMGEDGRHKEAILRSVIRRCLPRNIGIGTGFVLMNDGEQNDTTGQIDIIIYDNTYSVLFEEGDFIITTLANVKGIIEVKTTLDSSNITETIRESTENGNKINHSLNYNDFIFNGIFAYNTKWREENFVGARISKALTSCLRRSSGSVNHISLGKHFFIKYWGDDPHKYSII
jgi:hypothetical protein